MRKRRTRMREGSEQEAQKMMEIAGRGSSSLASITNNLRPTAAPLSSNELVFKRRAFTSNRPSYSRRGTVPPLLSLPTLAGFGNFGYWLALDMNISRLTLCCVAPPFPGFTHWNPHKYRQTQTNKLQSCISRIFRV